MKPPAKEELYTSEQKDQDLLAFVHHGYQEYIPHISIDCSVFGFQNNQLNILLMKLRGLDGWALPGGFIKHTEHADQAAERLLRERTGISRLFLQQFYTFSDLDRNKFTNEALSNTLLQGISKDNWLLGRTLSIGYYALAGFEQVLPTADMFTEECRWWPLDEHPPLLFDHKKMVERALHTLRLQLSFQPIGYNLLPKKFTMPELQKLYETILGKPLERTNFKRKMLNLGILERLEERINVGPHMPPYLYRFDKQQYEQALREGLASGW